MEVIAFDRTDEFRACTKLFHQRVLAGRLRLNPPHLKTNHRANQISNDLIFNFASKSKQLYTDSILTKKKLYKLELLLQSGKERYKDCQKMIDIIKTDINDLNKSKVDIGICINQIKEKSNNSQYAKHLQNVGLGLDYYLSSIVSDFRNFLESNKEILSQEYTTCDSGPDLVIDNVHAVNGNKTSNVVNNEHNSFMDINYIVSYSNTNHNQFNKSHINSNISNNNSAIPTASLFIHSNSLNHNQKAVKTNENMLVDYAQTHQNQHSDPSNQHLEQKQLQLTSPHPIPTLIDQEIRQRDAALRKVESTIVQLGEIYQQFSTLVQEQNDLVIRIDTHTDEMEMNVNAAHVHLLSFMRHISRQRSFMFKLFLTFLICFVLFAWLVR